MDQFSFMESVPAENVSFIEKLADLQDRLVDILKEKGWTQADLAKAMKKKESEISRWLNSPHNLTLKSITSIETVLEEQIIEVTHSKTNELSSYDYPFAFSIHSNELPANTDLKPNSYETYSKDAAQTRIIVSKKKPKPSLSKTVHLPEHYEIQPFAS